MAAVTFKAQVKERKIYPNDLRAWLTYLSQLEGKDVEVRIGKEAKSKSTQANRYYFGVVVAHVVAALEALQGVPFTTEEAHDVLKSYCNAKEVTTNKGIINAPRTTKGMTNEEFIAYVDRCIKWAAEYLSIDIPDSQDYFIEQQNK